MEQVFISYSRKDSDFVNLLVEELRDNFHDVWMDTSDIKGGTDWESEIRNAIASSYAFILFNSKDSKESEWVGKEVNMFYRTTQKIPLIPLKIDRSSIPGRLARNQSIDFSIMYDGSDIDTIRNYRLAVRQLLEALEIARPMLRYLKELKHSDAEIREEAARQLGNLGDTGAAVELIKKLNDLDADVRYESALALGKLKIKNAYKPLVRLMKEEEDGDVIAAASTALGELGLVEAIAPLSKNLTNTDRYVRASTARALGRLKSVSAVGALIKLLRTDSISDVREAATEALVNIGGTQAERALNRIAQSNLLGRERKRAKGTEGKKESEA